MRSYYIIIIGVPAILCLILVLNTVTLQSIRLSQSLKDLKDFKKFIKSKRSVLICFVEFEVDLDKEFSSILKWTVRNFHGEGTIVVVECLGDSIKLCKQLKIYPKPLILKHYNNGKFHKDYDRKLTRKSLWNFMKHPTENQPWEEEETAQDIVHLDNTKELYDVLEKNDTAVLVLFYIPWCGACKKLKPEYSKAATHLKGRFILAAVDVFPPENFEIRKTFEINEFPTLLYFAPNRTNAYEYEFIYEGDYNKDTLIAFMMNPTKELAKWNNKPDKWYQTPNTFILHLNEQYFSLINNHESVLVLFYAPWCLFCERLKSHYENAAVETKKLLMSILWAAVDITENDKLVKRFKISDVPTLKYFINGEFQFDTFLFDNDSLIDFALNPHRSPQRKPPRLVDEIWPLFQSEIVHLDDSNFTSYIKKKKFVLTFFYFIGCMICQKYLPEYMIAATRFKSDNKRMFVAVECRSIKSKNICFEEHGEGGQPTIKLYKYGKYFKDYIFEKTEKEFIKFVEKLIPDTAISQSNYYQFVKMNDIDIAFQNAKYLFAIFVTTDCEQCKLIEADFLKISKLYRNNQEIRFAIIDASVNPDLIANYHINVYPTLILVNTNYRSIPHKFNAEMNLDGFKTFLQFYLQKDEL